MKELSAREARNHFSEIIHRAAFGKERLVVTKHGKGVAAIIPIEDLQALEEAAFEKAIELGNQKYGAMLKRLAE